MPLTWYQYRLSLQAFLPPPSYSYVPVENAVCIHCEKPISGQQHRDWEYQPQWLDHGMPLPDETLLHTTDYILVRACLAQDGLHVRRLPPYPPRHAPELVAHAPAPTVRELVLVTSDKLAPYRVVFPEALTDPMTAMGAAAWYAGSAALDYGLIADDHQPERLPEELDRYIAGEFCARLAQECLELVYAELSDYSQLSPECRKYARQVKVWVSTSRQRAAQTLSIRPVPPANDNIEPRRRSAQGEFAQLDHFLAEPAMTRTEFLETIAP